MKNFLQGFVKQAGLADAIKSKSLMNLAGAGRKIGVSPAALKMPAPAPVPPSVPFKAPPRIGPTGVKTAAPRDYHARLLDMLREGKKPGQRLMALKPSTPPPGYEARLKEVASRITDPGTWRAALSRPVDKARPQSWWKTKPKS